MKVVHLNTSDFGGAAIAAIQLHEALLEQGVESDLLTLNKTRNDVPRHHRVAPFDLGGSPTIDMLRYKARRAMEVLGVLEDRRNAPDNKALLDRPPGHEIFTVPYSYFQILDHPLVQAADVIHLHWVSYGMVDQRAFFLACTKRVVWTMHDMNPFTGGCHHADACEGFIDLCYNCPQLKDPDMHTRIGVTRTTGSRIAPIFNCNWSLRHNGSLIEPCPVPSCVEFHVL